MGRRPVSAGSPSGGKIAWLKTMALAKKPGRSPAEGELPFEYDFEHPAEEVLTAYAGIPLFVRALRPFQVPTWRAFWC